jgi:hypothetical protein
VATFSNRKSELLKVPLDRADQIAASDDLSHLWPFSNGVVCQRHPEDVGETCRAIRNGALISHGFDLLSPLGSPDDPTPAPITGAGGPRAAVQAATAEKQTVRAMKSEVRYSEQPGGVEGLVSGD